MYAVLPKNAILNFDFACFFATPLRCFDSVEFDARKALSAFFFEDRSTILQI